MARLVRNGNVENCAGRLFFWPWFFLFVFSPNNPFGPITTNERTNDILYSHRDFLFYSIHPSIPLTLFPSVFLSFFVCFFPFIGLTSSIHPSGQAQVVHVHTDFPPSLADFCTPPPNGCTSQLHTKVLAINRLFHATYILSFYSSDPRLLVTYLQVFLGPRFLSWFVICFGYCNICLFLS